jgi:peptide/nickel transport system substrate-binding protein
MAQSRIHRRQLITGAAALALASPARRVLAQATAPRRGGVPLIALPAIVEDLLGTQGHDWPLAWLRSLVYEAPLRPSLSGEIVAGAAVAYLRADDWTHVDLATRTGVGFSDSAVLRAEDIAASIERAIEYGRPDEAWRWTGVQKIDVPRAGRVRLVLDGPDATLAASLASSLVAVAPEGTSSGSAAFGDLPPGTGPFVPARVEGDTLHFRSNRLYRVVGQPRFDGCSVVAVGQEIERTSRLVTGLIDIVPDVQSLDIPLLQENPRVALVGDMSRRQCAVVPQVGQGPLDDVRVRRLVASVIDRRGLVEGATAGTAVPSDSLFPPQHWAGSGSDAVARPSSATRVRSALADLGLLPGWPLRLICPEAAPALANAAILLQEQMAEAGIAVSIDLLAEAEMLTSVADGAFDLMMTFLPLWTDPHEIAYPWLHSEGARNVGGYTSRRVDWLLTLARSAETRAARGALYREIDRIVAQEVPLIPLFATPWYDGVRTRIAGYRQQVPPSALGVASAWFPLS